MNVHSQLFDRHGRGVDQDKDCLTVCFALIWLILYLILESFVNGFNLNIFGIPCKQEMFLYEKLTFETKTFSP